VYLQTRDFEKAVDRFRVAAAAEPYNVSAAYNLFTALSRAGRGEEGEAAKQRFLQLRDSAYKSALGSNYLEQGRYAEALASTGAEAVDEQTADVAFTRKDVVAGAASTLPRSALVLADVDADGALDVVESGLPSLRVLRNEPGRFVDVTGKSGLTGVPAIAAVAETTTTTAGRISWC